MTYSPTPPETLLCVYDMSGATDLFDSIARNYNYNPAEIGFLALSVAIDHIVGCSEDTIVEKLRGWVEESGYQLIIGPDIDTNVFIGFWQNIDYLASIVIDAMRATVNFSFYDRVSPNRVSIVGDVLYLFIDVKEIVQ